MANQVLHHPSAWGDTKSREKLCSELAQLAPSQVKASKRRHNKTLAMSVHELLATVA
jgi:hypothetical protein